MAKSVCGWVQSVLGSYLDGELSPTSARTVRRHVHHCEPCAARLRLMMATWDLLGEAPAMPVRSGFTARMMDRVAEEEELAALAARAESRRLVRLVLRAVAGVAAGLVVGVCLYAWTGRLGRPSGIAEREVGEHVSFLYDLELMDEVALIEAMERQQHEADRAEREAEGI